ncbi:hypothetical protein CDAR_538151 [Caerostris darwini]|uniref:Uncharacterized protein n=1 Tax=Caerostris darwini TaxID=1538125 RepID=A0AAV4UCJ8_9ARAC|nr:hypothetical protein CDAR_538151 [Caerostris darwini]
MVGLLNCYWEPGICRSITSPLPEIGFTLIYAVFKFPGLYASSTRTPTDPNIPRQHSIGRRRYPAKAKGVVFSENFFALSFLSFSPSSTMDAIRK